MLLAIEIGNTTVAAAVFDGPTVVARWRGQTHAAEDQPAALLAACHAEDIVVAGVVPEVLARWEARLKALSGAPPLVVGRDLPAPLTSSYAPGQLGIDRLLAAAAAVELCGSPVLVADCGTATTLDAVAPDGCFVGGAILCGLETARDALAQRAALLPRVELASPPAALGQNTVECLQAGLVLGHAGAIAWLAKRLRRELAAPWAPLVGSGGWAPLLAQAVPDLFTRLEPDLALLGLKLAWERWAGEPLCEA
jgi:type III pantothenate kinase